MQNNYNVAARLFHRLVLGHEFISEASFEIEQWLGRFDETAAINNRHIFVSSLARAGTTIFMRGLHASGVFRSLTYRDMPFVLMPNIWRWLTRYSRSEIGKIERAHGDGIMVDYDSPEAFEEVFWRVFAGNKYITPDFLIPMDADDEIIKKFRQYIASILNASQSKSIRYLSKNNNNVLRLTSIKKAFPNAIIVVPFRHPLHQALSLFKQHIHFKNEHSMSQFTQSYMTWLGHHEFGGDHRRYRFGIEENPFVPNCIDYWLTIWLHTYQWLRLNAPTDAVFLSYETLCENTEDVWPKMRGLFDFDGGIPEEIIHKTKIDEGDFGDVNKETIEGCMHLYESLMDKMKENFSK